MAFVAGWYLSPTHAGARELVQEAKRIHNLPLARCYLVEIQPLTNDVDERAPINKLPRQVRAYAFAVHSLDRDSVVNLDNIRASH